MREDQWQMVHDFLSGKNIKKVFPEKNWTIKIKTISLFDLT